MTTTTTTTTCLSVENYHDKSEHHKRRPERNDRWRRFRARKETCLSKRDKSSAGRIDPRAADVCAAINAREEYHTTSSCAGRCFLYQGDGVKSHHQFAVVAATESDETTATATTGRHGYFRRYRVNHSSIRCAERYFDLDTLNTDPTGGGDPIAENDDFRGYECARGPEEDDDDAVWLRFEPFLLHVSCRSLEAARILMAAARPSFKNVGLTSWSEDDDKYTVAIWGDEGLDMPLRSPSFSSSSSSSPSPLVEWWKQLVNERHERNWAKIDRFAAAVKALPADRTVDEKEDDDDEHDYCDEDVQDATTSSIPKRYEIVGDVAIVNYLLPPLRNDDDKVAREQLHAKLRALGDSILSKQKSIKLVVLRARALSTAHRSADDGLFFLAGVERRLPRTLEASLDENDDPALPPLLTTHVEHGVRCVVDLRRTFFTPRMGPERLRVRGCVARGESVLCLFAGCAPEALAIAGRTAAARVVSVESNPHAVACARKSRDMLARNVSVAAGAADRWSIVEADAADFCRDEAAAPDRPRYHRVSAPRPKGDGDANDDDGAVFLRALLPVLREDGGECHWYDFCADHELPRCERTRAFVTRLCEEAGVGCEISCVVRVGSVAKRQYRVCVDFRLTGRLSERTTTPTTDE